MGVGGSALRAAKDGMTERILIVEDDEFVSDMLADVLRAQGYTVATTDSAFGAAALVRDLQSALVLLDLGLPFRPGTDLIDELKSDARTMYVPIVVVSGLTESLSEERRKFAAAVLSKPVLIEHLLDVVVRACARTAEPRSPG